jgi:hypothetical protein
MHMTVPHGAAGNGEPYETWIEIGLVGEHRALDALPLTEAEKRAERKRRNEAIARKIPIGFRLDHSVSDSEAGRFPDVPRFDTPGSSNR